MKKIKLAVIVGVFLGFLIGLQQSSSIIISSLHDLGELPYLSVLAVAFNIVLAGLLMSVLLTLAVSSLSFFPKRSARWKSSTWVSILLAIGATAWGYVFLGLKFLPILSKNPLIPLVLLVITVVAGGVLGFMLYSSWQAVVKRKKIESKLNLATNIGSNLCLVLYAALILFVFINITNRVRNGKVGFALGEFGRHNEGKTSILLITIDALRADSLTEDLMPNTFAFAQKGLSHPQAYAPSPWTPPSFVAMLTGKDPGGGWYVSLQL